MAIPLANGEEKHSGDINVLKKVRKPWKMCEVPNPHWARVFDYGLNSLLRRDPYPAVGNVMDAFNKWL